MRITAKTEDHNFTLRLPTRLFLNPVSAVICARKMDIPYLKMRKLFKVIRKSRHLLKGQPLFSAISADGDIVEIWV